MLPPATAPPPPRSCEHKIRGLCVSPDLQCVLCVTEDLEGVYILAVDNLGAHEETPSSTTATTAVPDLDSNPSRETHEDPTDGGGGSFGSGGGGADGGRRSASTTVAGVAGPAAARPPPRVAAATAFPSLLHLASRGQRRRAGGPVAHPAAEPVFIASLARRGGTAGSGKGQQDYGTGWRRHSTGASGGGDSASGGGRRGGRRNLRSNAQLECLWWAARNGDHLAVIGGPDGEVLVCGCVDPFDGQAGRVEKLNGSKIFGRELRGALVGLRICLRHAIGVDHRSAGLPHAIAVRYPESFPFSLAA